MAMAKLIRSGAVSCRSGVIDLIQVIRWLFFFILILVMTVTILCRTAHTEKVMSGDYDKLKEMERIWVFDGSGIHNVGNLILHTTNWGCFGSYPDWNAATSHFVSAQWPANSGVEYLWIAGLWVGALRGGTPVVTTAAFDVEFMPPGTEDPAAKIYESYEGIEGGKRHPTPADDDKDGRIDEDWQNGVDDDGDGLIDEDFAAIGKQMFTSWYTDDHPLAAVRNPEHTPLHLFVRQESYQWDDRQFWDFVGVEYKIKNYGRDIIEDIYIGFFADCDVGVRGSDNLAQDDLTGRYSGIRCARKGEIEIPVKIDIAYFYDSDGDDGMATGYFGILFLGHDIDPLGETAPAEVGITTYQNFSGEQEFEAGGDPTNDDERYKLMSSTTFDKNTEVPRDYRMMMATGPFLELLPDSVMTLQVAFVCGEGLEGMLEAAASAAMVFDGNWFNVDMNSITGVDGRETPVYGPVTEIDPDTCDMVEEYLAAVKGEVIWINADCARELALWEGSRYCMTGDAEFKDFQTGVDGKETQVHWLVGTAPPPPKMRIVPGDHMITVLWDNFSEMIPDPSTQEFDFEGYRIWRADNWDRPYGTSVLTGPSRDLWQLLEERDIVNGVLADVDFKRPFSEGGWEYDPLSYMQDREHLISYFEENLYYSPLDSVPCPPGLTDEVCDTLEAIARYNLGFEGGLQYYKFVDENVHNGMHYFYSIVAYDHTILYGMPYGPGKYGDPASNFQYTYPVGAPALPGTEEDLVFVVPNPATASSMSPWRLEPNMDDPTGIKIEFRNMPGCRATVRVFTIAGDLVAVLHHEGNVVNGSLGWDLVSRNGQDVTSGVYLFTVDPEDGRFPRSTGKFTVIR